MFKQTDKFRAGQRHTSAFAVSHVAIAVTVLSWPASQAGAQAFSERRAANMESTVDASIKPGDDFFAYANGAWLKATTIPAGKERWGVRQEVEETARQRVTHLLDDARTARPGTSARKVADFRTALLNQSAIDASGLAPFKPQLDEIARVQDKSALARLLGKGMRADVDPLNWGVFRSSTLLGLSVEESIHGEQNNVAFLVQGGLGLPDREPYVGTDHRMLMQRTQYRTYVARLLELSGFDNASQRAEAVLALETGIAQTQTTREQSANDHRADTVWSRESFTQRAPGMDWPAYFAAAGLAQQHEFVAWQPSAVKGAAALVASQPLEVWKDYLRVRAISAYADALPGEFAREVAALRSAVNGDQPIASREERVNELTQLAMSEAVGRMYSERYFPASQKARLQGIVAEVKEAFARIITVNTWMTPRTKALSLQKLKTLYIGMGYPERWSDYSDLVVDPSDAAGNIRRVAERNYRRTLGLLGKPIDRKQWQMAPQTPGALLVFQLNSYVFSAALLQPPKFDPSASDAAIYGSIGATVGHDVTHFVDELGADYEVNGNWRMWWSPEDVNRFQQAQEPLISQFSSYRPFPDVAINGKLTLRENLADMGGLAAAFDAYRRTLGVKSADKEYVRKNDREFFIAFAQSYRAKIGDAAMRTQAATNDHAPEMYRVATVRNFDAWYDAFDVQPGQRLYLPPSARVHVW